jgi:hypothetical protein
VLAPGIRFNDCVFSEPIALVDWVPPRCAGLYVILVRDAAWAPKAFRPVCFGEFGNNAPAEAVRQECAQLLPGGAARTAFLAFLALPFTTTTQRWALCRELVGGYHPSGQAVQTTPTDLVRRLDDLERRNQEQAAQLGYLRASSDAFLDTRSAPRRRIGFLPDFEPAG